MHTVWLKMQDHIQRDGLDLMYADINFTEIGEAFVETILSSNKCCFTTLEGKVENDAQIIICPDFAPRRCS